MSSYLFSSVYFFLPGTGPTPALFSSFCAVSPLVSPTHCCLSSPRGLSSPAVSSSFHPGPFLLCPVPRGTDGGLRVTLKFGFHPTGRWLRTPVCSSATRTGQILFLVSDETRRPRKSGVFFSGWFSSVGTVVTIPLSPLHFIKRWR